MNLTLKHIIGGILAFKNRKSIFIKVCGICGGNDFIKVSSEGKENYKAEFECEECGATGIISETWIKAEI